MLVHYIKIAWRYLLKQKSITFINISGLTVGITVSLLIFLYVQYDLGYDRFNTKAERIYRIGLHGKMGETEFTQTYTTAMLASSILNTCPNVLAAVRMDRQSRFMKYDDGKGNVVIHKEDRIMSADSSLFDIFTLKTLAGDPRKALKEPGKVILNRNTVYRYFGKTDNYNEVLNKQLQVNIGDNYIPVTIAGIIEDLPDQSHFHFDILISNENFPFSQADNWYNNNFRTYILLDKENDIQKVADILPEIYRKNMGGDRFDAWVAEGNRWESFVQPLLDIHLRSNVTGEWEPNSDIRYDWILSVVSLFIILIACVNFINLTTSKAVVRAREIGVKKTLGSRRYQLVIQLLCEALIISFLAVNFALVCAKLILPEFSSFTGKHLALTFLGGYWDVLIMSGFILLLGVFSGLYPAFYLTSVQPVQALSGKNMRNRGGWFFRNALVVFQFVISIFIIICSFLINKQLDYIRNDNLGFNKENLVVIQNAGYLGNKITTMKESLLEWPDIKSVSAAYSVPGEGQGNMQFRPEGFEDNVLLDLIFADEDYAETYGLHMISGRFFDRKHAGDSTSIIINRAAMENLGWEDPVGKTIRVYGKSGDPYKVIGVVNDYHYISMHEKIRPFVIMPTFSNKSRDNDFLTVRIDGKHVPETIRKLRATWKEYSDLPFEYFFLDESYDQLYANEAKTQSIFMTFSLISIFIALLGLFGLVIYNIEQRTKEIGIRKTFGASAWKIVMLLSGNFSRWILLGFVIAVPLSWWFMNLWLRNFAYKTGFPVWIYLFTFLLVILTAWLTTGYHSVKAALKNPVEALRYE